jgi:hypothetical protein
VPWSRFYKSLPLHIGTTFLASNWWPQYRLGKKYIYHLPVPPIFSYFFLSLLFIFPLLLWLRFLFPNLRLSHIVYLVQYSYAPNVTVFYLWERNSCVSSNFPACFPSFFSFPSNIFSHLNSNERQLHRGIGLGQINFDDPLALRN